MNAAVNSGGSRPPGPTPEPSGPSTVLSSMMSERQSVAVRVLEPGHLRTVAGRPHAGVVLLDRRHTEEVHAFHGEVGDLVVEILDVPAEHREGLYVERAPDIGDPDGADATPEHDGEVVGLHDRQAEHALIEGPGAPQIGGGDESDGLSSRQHGLSVPPAATSWSTPFRSAGAAGPPSCGVAT